VIAWIAVPLGFRRGALPLAAAAVAFALAAWGLYTLFSGGGST
jgi:hypothetical protein